MLQGIIDRLLSWKSTALAVVTGLLTILSATGVISAEALTEGITASGQLYEVIVTLLGVVVTIAQLFKKTPVEVEAVKSLFK
jgi:hypothetical protein